MRCEALSCIDSAGQRVRARGVTLWLCDLHAGALADALHLRAPVDRRPVTKKRNRFDEERRTDMRARGNP